jgi:hypothetical protein
LELINLKNVSLLQFEKRRKNTKEAKREQLMDDKKRIPENSTAPISTIRGGIGIEEEFRSN